MKNLIKVFVMMVIVIYSNQTFAQPKIKQHQINQHQRIKQGVKSGEITVAERQHLKEEQQRIRLEKQMAKADGHVSKKEKRIIEHEQRKASKEIYQAKHNEIRK